MQTRSEPARPSISALVLGVRSVCRLFSGRRAEFVVAVLVVILLAIRAAPMLHAMASTSLWNDEIYTIEQFSAKGLVTSLTDYHVPNNHVLFNALNSLLPGADSVRPLRARLISFMAAGASLLVLFGFFARRGRPLDAALCAALIFNGGALSLILQARGYGLLTLFALLVSLAALEFVRQRSATSLAVVAVSTALGAWTVPVFLAFAGPLLLLLFLSTGDRRVLLTGLATLAAVLLVYSPMWGQILHNSWGYADLWGRRYAGFEAVSSTVQRFLPLRGTAPAFLLLSAAVMAPAWVPPRRRKAIVGLRILALAVVIFLASCLYVGTPLVRTTAFVAVPISILLTVTAGEIWRQRRWILFRPAVLLIALCAITAHTVHGLRSFHFVPLENWMGTARIVERVFPEDLSIYSNFRPQQLSRYLQEPIAWATDLDDEAFRSGRLVYVESGKDVELKQRLHQLANGEHALISVPQGYAEEQLVMFYPPARSSIESVAVNGHVIDHRSATDRSRSTTLTASVDEGQLRLSVQFAEERSLRSLVVLWGACPRPTSIRVAAISATSQAPQPEVESYGDVLVVSLGDRSMSSIDLQGEIPSPAGSLCIDEIWAYPEVGGEI